MIYALTIIAFAAMAVLVILALCEWIASGIEDHTNKERDRASF